MNSKHLHSSLLTMGFALSLVLLVLTGCAETRRVEFTPSTLLAQSGSTRVPVKAALVLDDDFKNYNAESKLYGGRALYPLGEYLLDYATIVAKNTFEQINVVSSLPAATNTADVILIPRVIRSDFSIFSTTSIISVEWTVKDRTGQNLIWLNTFEGQGTEERGNFNYNKHNMIRARKVFDDLTIKTLKGLNESPEIKRLSSQFR